jgi:hypothetical protein
MKHILLTSVMAVSCLIAVQFSSMAANRPAWQLGSFSKTIGNIDDCVGFARNALLSQHYQVLHQDRFTVLGGDDHVVVEVACAPQQGHGVWIVVSAFSSDSVTAESARNAVREFIIRATPPITPP